MFKKMFVPFVWSILCVSLASCATIVTSPDPLDVSPYVKIFGENETIYFNGGGTISDFVSAAEDVLKNNRHVRINGLCGSACAIFADKARPNVCITRKAVFAFHMKSNITNVVVVSEGPSSRVELQTVLRSPLTPLSEDINKWVLENGGFPYDGLLKMDAKQASAFWPMCK